MGTKIMFGKMAIIYVNTNMQKNCHAYDINGLKKGIACIEYQDPRNAIWMA